MTSKKTTPAIKNSTSSNGVSTPLRVFMTSTSYPRTATDWRAPFIRQLVEALAMNPSIQLNLWSPKGDLPANVVYACTSAEAIWLNQLMEQGGIAHVLRQGQLKQLSAPITLLSLLGKAYRRQSVDLFHVNWLQNALPLRRVRSRQPALISVLGSDFRLLRLPLMTSLLRQVFKQRRCILAPNAPWMVTELEKRFGDIARIIPIPFGIDRKWYELSRSWHQQKVLRWIVVLRITRRKMGHLFTWGEKIFSGNHELHLFGPMQEPLTIPSWVHYHGATSPEVLQDFWFPQAAGLISLSQHDEGRPQVMLEAMAAGVPIIASPLAAHTDLLKHQKTGWLVDSPEDFAAGIEWLSVAEHNENIANQARTWVKENIGTWMDCAQRYIQAYGQLF